MLRKSLSSIVGASALIILIATGSSAQTTTPTPNPAQQDATRPPSTQQNQSIPEQARPTNPNPTAPPAETAPPAQAPPGVSVPPSNPTIEQPAPSTTPIVTTEQTPSTNSTQ